MLMKLSKDKLIKYWECSFNCVNGLNDFWGVLYIDATESMES